MSGETLLTDQPHVMVVSISVNVHRLEAEDGSV